MRIFSILLLRLTFVFSTIYYCKAVLEASGHGAPPQAAVPKTDTQLPGIHKFIIDAGLHQAASGHWYTTQAQTFEDRQQDHIFHQFHGGGDTHTNPMLGPACDLNEHIFIDKVPHSVQLLQPPHTTGMTFRECSKQSYSRSLLTTAERVVVSGFKCTQSNKCISVTATGVNPNAVGSCYYIKLGASQPFDFQPQKKTYPQGKRRQFRGSGVQTDVKLTELHQNLEQRFLTKPECGETVTYAVASGSSERSHKIIKLPRTLSKCREYLTEGFLPPGELAELRSNHGTLETRRRRVVVTGFETVTEPEGAKKCQSVMTKDSEIDLNKEGICAVTLVSARDYPLPRRGRNI